jgi:hypothetical protein
VAALAVAPAPQQAKVEQHVPLSVAVGRRVRRRQRRLVVMARTVEVADPLPRLAAPTNGRDGRRPSQARRRLERQGEVLRRRPRRIEAQRLLTSLQGGRQRSLPRTRLGTMVRQIGQGR